MPIDRFVCLAAGGGIMLALLFVGSHPVPQGWDKVAHFVNAPDSQGKVAVEYGVYGVPETFFVARDGTIRAKHVGALTDSVIRARLEQLL